MSKGLENLVNTSAATADYPWKNIKDDSGAGDGTPLDMISHADYHQTFRKLLDDGGITPNNLPDNVTNGYQYIEALKKKYKRSIGTKTVSVNTALAFSDYNKHVIASGSSAQIQIVLIAKASLQEGDNIIVYNNSSYPVELLGNSATINGSATIILPLIGDFIELQLDKAGSDWKIVNSKITNHVTNIFTVGVTPAFENSWSALQTIKFRVNADGLITFQGIAQRASASANPIFTLPVGYRPDRTVLYPITVNQSGNILDYMTIDTDGTVQVTNTVTGGSLNVYFENISFYLTS